MGISKEPVRLRQRKTSSGLISLYLDIYVDGRRSYEYLKMYLVPEKTRADKEKNKQTLLFADAIRSKRVVEVRNGKFGFTDNRKSKVRFFDYFNSLCEQRKRKFSKGCFCSWRGALLHLEFYESRRDICLGEITPEWVKGFVDFLENKACAFSRGGHRRKARPTLSPNTQALYFDCLSICFNQALREELVTENPCRKVVPPKTQESKRMYLTFEEVLLLVKTPCKRPIVKDTFLFSCLTGLRWSDVARLRWRDVHQQGDFSRIIFTQKKTSGQEYLDVTDEAAALMGARGDAEDLVFKNNYSSCYTNKILDAWTKAAGIDKKITFHCARHTFAIMMLDLGADIYTVSKLLGHREITTTQIYAKVLDKKKQEAIKMIPKVGIVKESEND
ncbi:tyrosine-type recombinase/integrase [Alloprevotella tannerae]